VAGAWKEWFQLAVATRADEGSAVVEVQVAEDDQVDVRGREAQLAQPVR